MTNNSLKTGIVKFYFSDVGYGFIIDDETNEDVFVHLKQLKESGLNELNKDNKVSFIKNSRHNRYYATNIKLL